MTTWEEKEFAALGRATYSYGLLHGALGLMLLRLIFEDRKQTLALVAELDFTRLVRVLRSAAQVKLEGENLAKLLQLTSRAMAINDERVGIAHSLWLYRVVKPDAPPVPQRIRLKTANDGKVRATVGKLNAKVLTEHADRAEQLADEIYDLLNKLG